MIILDVVTVPDIVVVGTNATGVNVVTSTDTVVGSVTGVDPATGGIDGVAGNVTIVDPTTDNIDIGRLIGNVIGANATSKIDASSVTGNVPSTDVATLSGSLLLAPIGDVGSVNVTTGGGIPVPIGGARMVNATSYRGGPTTTSTIYISSVVSACASGVTTGTCTTKSIGIGISCCGSTSKSTLIASSTSFNTLSLAKETSSVPMSLSLSYDNSISSPFLGVSSSPLLSSLLGLGGELSTFLFLFGGDNDYGTSLLTFCTQRLAQ